MADDSVTLARRAAGPAGSEVVERVEVPDDDRARPGAVDHRHGGVRAVRLIVDVGVAELFVEGAAPLTSRLPTTVRVTGGTAVAEADGGRTPDPRRPSRSGSWACPRTPIRRSEP